jgi:hypothetical protein
MQRYMFTLVALMSVLLNGCASVPPSATELAATVSFVEGDRPLDRGAGIYSVGNYNLPREPSLVVYVAPGYREIGYNCPGYIFVDGAPTVSYKFWGGEQYEIFCDKNGKPVIRKKASVGT